MSAPGTPDWPLILELGSVVTAGAMAFATLRQRVKDLEKGREEDRAAAKALHEEIQARVVRAEAAAGEVKGLAMAVEHMGARFSDQMKYLTDTIGLKFDAVATKVEALQSEVRVRRRSGGGQQRAKTPRA